MFKADLYDAYYYGSKSISNLLNRLRNPRMLAKYLSQHNLNLKTSLQNIVGLSNRLRNPSIIKRLLKAKDTEPIVPNTITFLITGKRTSLPVELLDSLNWTDGVLYKSLGYVDFSELGFTKPLQIYFVDLFYGEGTTAPYTYHDYTCSGGQIGGMYEASDELALYPIEIHIINNDFVINSTYDDKMNGATVTLYINPEVSE